MRKQFLWIKSPGLHYLVPGNVNFTAGEKGSLSFWYHPSIKLPVSDTLWELVGDADNGAKVGWDIHAQGTMMFQVTSGGTNYKAQIFDMQSHFDQQWWLVTATWDFTTPNAGILRLYVNSYADAGSCTSANAPATPCMKMYVGGQVSSSSHEKCFDDLALYDAIMTRDEHLSRLGSASDLVALRNARRATPTGNECSSGEMTFLAGYDGTYDAVIASGDATAYFDTGAEGYAERALLDDGARYRGRKLILPLGIPRHDGSIDDRLPMSAVFEPFARFGIGTNTTLVNEEKNGRVQISSVYDPAYGEGVGWLHRWLDGDMVQPPFTVRLRVHMPNATNPHKLWTCLGPIAHYNGGMHGGVFGSWGTGAILKVVADAGNTVSHLKTDLGTTTDNYWTGAEFSILNGNCAGTRLKVASYDALTKAVTLAGALAEIPVADCQCVVDFRGRICPVTADGIIETQSMEAWLWEEWGGDEPWVEFEVQQDDVRTMRVVRCNKGRTSYMEFGLQRPYDSATGGWMFGKAAGIGPSEGYSADIKLESIEIDGPPNYQRLPAHTNRYGRKCAPADDFTLIDPDTGTSTRVWRSENVERKVNRPVKYSDPAGTITDLAAPNTWRHECRIYAEIHPQPNAQETIVLVRGTSVDGVQQLGYLRGTFDGTRMHWEDETPPPGRNNPFMLLDDLKATARTDSDWGYLPSTSYVQVMQTDDGDWVLYYTGSHEQPDHYITRALVGAEDRWSFSHADHYWPQNPACPGVGGVDKIAPDFEGVGLWGNRDSEWVFIHNPYAECRSERFLGYARGKTDIAIDNVGTNLRPMIGCTTGDFRSFSPLPHGNTLSPLPGMQIHSYIPYVGGPDSIHMLVEFYGLGLRLLSSEDGLHFEQTDRYFIPGGELPGEPENLGLLATTCVGDYRIFFYSSPDFKNYATLKLNREAQYSLNASALSGMLETPIIEQPEGGWSDLHVNVDPKAGAVKIEVINPQTELPIAGYGADDCDILEEGVSRRVSWNGSKLSSLTNETLRLRICLERAATADEAPCIYAWEISDGDGRQRPVASAPQVEGKTNPAGLTDPTPEFSWEYSDPQGLTQSAYHVIVSSTQELLSANIGDLWDSGPVVSTENTVTYEGAALTELTTYFWKVRVRNIEGAWSEEW